MYKGSRIGWWWENFIALNVVLRGYDTIRVRYPSIAPIVYHTVNVSSLTRGKGFRQEFWASFDRSISYWRLKMFGVKVNFSWYLLGQAIIIRKKPLPRLIAFFYTLFAGLFYYIKYKNQVRRSLTNKII